jgi:hypothetical protein
MDAMECKLFASKHCKVRAYTLPAMADIFRCQSLDTEKGGKS